MNPIPATFHVRAEPRPEYIESQSHRVRPYRATVRVVAIFAALGVGFGYLVSAMVGLQKSPTGVKSSPIVAAPVVASAQPSFPVWKAPAPLPVTADLALTADFDPARASDRTPVATIPDARPRPSHVFAPVERAPDYTGFKVTAGH
ncbi:MAG: hypothetical protein Q8M31_22805 [Beijerinckiaceae bacterium]|nr:hypothetical protein [Beijerinckiaceae bacterium]